MWWWASVRMLFCSLKIPSQEGWANLNFLWKLASCASVTPSLYIRENLLGEMGTSPPCLWGLAQQQGALRPRLPLPGLHSWERSAHRPETVSVLHFSQPFQKRDTEDNVPSSAPKTSLSLKKKRTKLKTANLTLAECSGVGRRPAIGTASRPPSLCAVGQAT